MTEIVVSCVSCLNNLKSNTRIEGKQSVSLHSNDVHCALVRCKCVAESESQAGAEMEVLPTIGEPIEESSSLADIAFGDFVVDDNIPGAPSTVGPDFAEPDDIEAMAFVLSTLDPHYVFSPPEALDSHGLVTYCEEANHGFAMVYQAVSLGSSDAKCPGAVAAIMKERNNMERESVYADYSSAIELSQLRRVSPSALVVYAHLLLGCKIAETLLDWVWKARLVAGGNRVTNSFGLAPNESDLYGAPTSLEAIRIIVWWATMHREHGLLQADMNHAYLQTTLKGAPIHVVLPSSVWPESWYVNGVPKFKSPVLRLHKAMYGLRRSGFDWMAHCERILLAHEWLAVRDFVDSLFYKQTAQGPLLLCIYVDDLLASGHEPTLRANLLDMKIVEVGA